MGREIRRVPPNWEHPKKEYPDSFGRGYRVGFVPMLDETYIEAITAWIENHRLWEAGQHQDQIKYPDECKKYKHYAQWNGDAPQAKQYRPEWTEPASWYQLYETVSEGTPVTPPFATQAELVEYLVANGDFWDQERRKEKEQGMPVCMNCDPWSRKSAEAFVYGSGWCPSMMICDGQLIDGKNIASVKK